MPINLALCSNCFKLTELVSRVLYVLSRSNHLSSLSVTAQFEPYGSATMDTLTGSQSARAEIQGVASDRVYSKPRLPEAWVSSYLAFPSLP